MSAIGKKPNSGRRSSSDARGLRCPQDGAMRETEPDDVIPNDPEASREQAIARLKKRRDFQSHFFVYVVVNAMFWILWATTTAGYPWPAWISALWGIGLLLNGWDVYLRAPITEAGVDRELERLRSR